MKTVLLAGGFGTRLSEETHLKPKPMIEIGGKPLLWHIMKLYSHYGLNDFIVCLGYKGYVIKEYFANYFLHNANVTFHLQQNKLEVHDSATEPWTVTLVETGPNTQTGGRLKRIASYLNPDEHFCMTYGDGLSDVNLNELIQFATKSNRLATVTAIQPAGRFGALGLEGDLVTSFKEKPTETHWMSGGFFVLHPAVLDLIDGDSTHWEHGPMETLAARRELASYLHRGFWQPVDTLRDKIAMEKLWDEGNPPWRIWS